MVQAYLQIVLARCIPLFALDDKRNVGSEEQIHSKIQRGYNDYKAGRVQNAAGAFARFQESHSR